MLMALVRFHFKISAAQARLGVVACCAALALAYPSSAQQPVQPGAAQQPAAPAAQSGETQQPATPTAPQEVEPTPPPAAGGITEAELKQMLVGKALYLRDGYLDNSLSFNEYGRLIGHSPQGSYTLCAIQIDRVRITKHKVTLEGARYGLHFLGQLAFEDSSSAFDRVRITPNKKVVKITIDREMVVKPKKMKGEKGEAASNEKKEKNWKFWHVKPGAAPSAPAAPEPEEMSEADQLKASIAATPEEERPADAKSVTTTTSPEHATRVLKEALDKVFAQGLDERMMASLPDFWKLYYQAVAAKADYRPKDPTVFRQNTVDQKARLLTNFEPDSNEFAQASGVAGMAQYHAVVGPDGKVGEVAISRPIGFGLDESAVEAIKKAKFEPAIKDGMPVAVMLNLDVPFRIFSKRTNVHAPPEPADKPAEPILPGPYSVPRQ
jgi:TonB family protein